MERRLAAILLIDIVGYSRLTGLDEEGTIARQKAHRDDILKPSITQLGGRIVKSTGDGLLVEFASVVAAVRCAVKVQRELAGCETDVSEDRRIQYRIGVNLGDIIIDGDDILGDGVNVAARLEGLADPGGICISGSVYDQLVGKSEFSFRNAGELSVKNINRPIRAFYWVTSDPGPVPTDSSSTQTVTSSEFPTIAVLPLAVHSPEAEDQLFASGMVDDVITALAQFPEFIVVGSTTLSSTSGDKPQDLGARFVFEGSLRRTGARIRLNVKLMDVVTNSYVWVQKYDLEQDDLFLVQDQLTQRIVAAISPEIEQVERHRASLSRPGEINTWLLHQRGMAAFYETSMAGLEEAMSLFDEVATLEPNFAPAYAMAAEVRSRYCVQYVTDPSTHQTLSHEALALARQATSIAGRSALCLEALARAFAMNGRHRESVATAKQAVEINPGYARYHQTLGYMQHLAGLNEDAIKSLELATTLSPRDAYLAGFKTVYGSALLALERDLEVVDVAHDACQSSNPRWWSYGHLAAASHFLDRPTEARRALGELVVLFPSFRIEGLEAIAKNWQTQSWDRMILGLKGAAA